MRLLSKELILRHQRDRCPCTGFVTYVSDSEPVLVHCWGWEDYSDAYDDYTISISRDNGKTWSDPQIHWQSEDVVGGKIRFAETAALFDRDTGKLIVVTDSMLHPEDTLDVDQPYQPVVETYDPSTSTWSPRTYIDFGDKWPPAVSFSHPIKSSRGRLLYPVMRQALGSDGRPVHYQGCWAPVDESLTLIGEYADDGSIGWTLGNPVSLQPEVSSQGLDEHTYFETQDGRIAAILRGDNSMFPDRPGYKWLSFSEDDGMNWSDPRPLQYTSGEPVESGANNSALFKSIKDGKIYWIGNACLDGEKARGNYPRSSLSIMEVQEEPFELKRDTLWVIEEKNRNDSPDVAFSNFRFYQDRETGNLVLYMPRLCALGLDRMLESDYYRYVVEIS